MSPERCIRLWYHHHKQAREKLLNITNYQRKANQNHSEISPVVYFQEGLLGSVFPAAFILNQVLAGF